MQKIQALETTGQDWANYLSHEVSGNGLLCLVALLDRKPDAEILKSAVADLIALQPVLGCRFEDQEDPPVWIPVDGEIVVQEINAGSMQDGWNALMQNPSVPGRQLEAAILTTPDQTALCLRFDHAATDGGGAKRCLALLSRCYQRRFFGQTDLQSVLLDRTDDSVYASCGLSDYRQAMKREASAADPVMTVPYVGMEGRTAQYCLTTLPLSVVKRPGGTVNDRLLAAYGLALAGMCTESCAVSIHMTVDLRRYLEEASAPLACNLAGMAAVTLMPVPNASYSSALAEIQKQTAVLKTERVGLSSAALMTYMRTMPYRKVRSALLESGRKSRISGVAAPILSNLGQIAPDGLRFGDASVLNVLPLLPAMHAPAFLLGACSCGETLTLSAGFFSEERQAEKMERLLSDIRERLAEGAL